MENLSMEKERVKEQFKHKMGFYKVILRMIKLMAQESSNGRMEKSMKDNLENLCLMAKERLYIQMEKLHRVNGRKIIINLFQQLELEMNFDFLNFFSIFLF